MSDQAEIILENALNLSANERAEIAATLLQSLDKSASAAVDAAWSIEIERRIREIDEGRVALIPWEQILGEMRERIDG